MIARSMSQVFLFVVCLCNEPSALHLRCLRILLRCNAHGIVHCMHLQATPFSEGAHDHERRCCVLWQIQL